VLIQNESGWVVVAVGGAELSSEPQPGGVDAFVAEQIALGALVEFINGTQFTVVETEDTRIQGGVVVEAVKSETVDVYNGVLRRAVRGSVYIGAESDSIFVSVVCGKNPELIREYVDPAAAINTPLLEAISNDVDDGAFRKCLLGNAGILLGGVAICSAWDKAILVAVGAAPVTGEGEAARVTSTRIASADARRRLAGFVEGQEIRGLERGIEILTTRNDKVVEDSYLSSTETRNRVQGWVNRTVRGGSWTSPDGRTLYVALLCDLIGEQ